MNKIFAVVLAICCLRWWSLCDIPLISPILANSLVIWVQFYSICMPTQKAFGIAKAYSVNVARFWTVVVSLWQILALKIQYDTCTSPEHKTWKRVAGALMPAFVLANTAATERKSIRQMPVIDFWESCELHSTAAEFSSHVGEINIVAFSQQRLLCFS